MIASGRPAGYAMQSPQIYSGGGVPAHADAGVGIPYGHALPNSSLDPFSMLKEIRVKGYRELCTAKYFLDINSISASNVA
jgi:hypothetical protein